MSITINGSGDINATGNDIELNSTGTTDVTLALGGGNVGIGTATPSNKFVVSDNGAQGLEINPNVSGTTEILAYNRSGSAWNPFKLIASNYKVNISGAGDIISVDSDGLKFNGDTAAANALDDYEEGTFQTNLSPATSGTITIQSTADTLAYTKIGRLVTITGMISVTSTGSAVGSFVLLNNLPFTSADLTEFAGRGAGYVVFDDDSAGTRTPLGTFMLESSTQMRMYINAATVAGSDNFNVSFSYTTT